MGIIGNYKQREQANRVQLEQEVRDGLKELIEKGLINFGLTSKGHPNEYYVFLEGGIYKMNIVNPIIRERVASIDDIPLNHYSIHELLIVATRLDQR